jgi:hypothetical protein
MNDLKAKNVVILFVFLSIIGNHFSVANPLDDKDDGIFDQEFVHLKNRKDRFNFSIGMSFASFKTNGGGSYNLKALNDAKFSQSKSISASLFRQFSPFVYRKEYKIGYGFRFHELKTIGNLQQNYSNGIEENYHFELNFSSFEIPVYMRYKFFKQKIGISLSAGASLAIVLSKKDKLHYTEFYNGTLRRDEWSGAVYLNNTSGDGIMPSTFNAFTGLSFDFPFLKEQIIFLEATYVPYSNIANSTKISFYPAFSDVHVGIRF